MKAVLALMALAIASPGKAERMLKEAKVSLPEAVAKAGKDLKVVSAKLAEDKGRVLFVVEGVQGGTTHAVTLDAKTAELIEKKAVKVDHAARVAEARTSVPKAIEIALKRVAGKAVETEIEIEDGRIVIEVKVFEGGKVWEVEVDAETGDVLEVEEDDDDEDDEDDEDDDD